MLKAIKEEYLEIVSNKNSEVLKALRGINTPTLLNLDDYDPEVRFFFIELAKEYKDRPYFENLILSLNHLAIFHCPSFSSVENLENFKLLAAIGVNFGEKLTQEITPELLEDKINSLVLSKD